MNELINLMLGIFCNAYVFQTIMYNLDILQFCLLYLNKTEKYLKTMFFRRYSLYGTQKIVLTLSIFFPNKKYNIIFKFTY